MLLGQKVSYIRESQHLITEPILNKDFSLLEHPKYLNFIIECKSIFTPHQLYQEIRKIEDIIGHNRIKRWQPRSLDIDILLAAHHKESSFSDCQQLSISDEVLQIPHLRISERDFIVQLLQEDFSINFLSKQGKI